jgi:rhamnogalacturonyl hydrolase YesR
METRNSGIHEALLRLDRWVEQANWKAYDTFDGLSSPYAGILTLGRPLLKQVWQQAVRRFPVNLRPVLGIKPAMSTKGMAFFAQGYLRLHQTTQEPVFLQKAKFCLNWLLQNRSPAFRGSAWGNHFDYQSRGGNIPKGAPTIVWTGLIAHAFLDAYEALGDEDYLAVAKSSCDFILDELGWIELEEGVCLRYYPNAPNLIHNSGMIGASLLARVHSLLPTQRYREMAERAVRFTLHHQTEQGGWYYGVGPKWAWIDSFHTGYVLESLHIFCRCTDSDAYRKQLQKGYTFFIETFFKSDGTPRYYAQKTPPLDIQCASQAIQTLVNLRELHPDSVAVAERVAQWTIANMQDKSGYFYYRKYPFITNKTPTLHWGQATMFASLALLDRHLASDGEPARKGRGSAHFRSGA